MKPRVFVVQPQAKYNITRAEKFGEITYVCHSIQPLNVTDSIARITKQLNQHGFNPHSDYILMTGQLLAVSYLLAVAAKISQAVRILIYDAKSENYIPQIFAVESQEKCTDQ